MGKEVEKIRKKLKVGQLKGDDRSDLFKGFQKAGGKVVDVKDSHRNVMNEKFENYLQEVDYRKKESEKQKKEREAKEKEIEKKNREAQAKKEKEKEREKEEPEVDKENDKHGARDHNTISSIEQRLVQKITEDREKEEKLNKGISVLSSKWACILARVFNLFGSKFSRKFVREITADFEERMKLTKQILVSVLHQDAELSYVIRDALKKREHSMYYELVFRFDKMFDEVQFQYLAGAMVSGNPIPTAKSQVIKVFHEMYTIQPYYQILKNAVSIVLKMEEMARKLNESVVNRNIRVIQNCADFAFGRFYQKMSLLADFYYKEELASGKSISFKDFLGQEESDKLGFYAHQWKEQDEKVVQKQPIQEEIRSKPEDRELSDDPRQNITQVDGIPDYARKGLELIYERVSFDKEKDFFQQSNDTRGLFDINDKVFLTYTLFDYFEKEFTFLFNSDIVQYNIFLDKLRRKVDTKGTLKMIHYKLNEVYRQFKEYLKLLEEKRKYTRVGVAVQENSREMEHVNHQRDGIFKTINYQSRKLLEDFIKVFHYVVKDDKSEHRVITNPDERIEFGLRSAKERFCNHMTVERAFDYALQYLSGFYYLLKAGDLIPDQLDLTKPQFLHLDMNRQSSPRKASEPPAPPRENPPEKESSSPSSETDNPFPDLQ